MRVGRLFLVCRNKAWGKREKMAGKVIMAECGIKQGWGTEKLNYAKRTQRERKEKSPMLVKERQGKIRNLNYWPKKIWTRQLQGTPQSKPEYPVRRSRNICKGFRNGCKWYRSRTPGEPQRTKSEQREIAKKGGVEKWRVDALVWVWPLINKSRVQKKLSASPVWWFMGKDVNLQM